MTGRQPETVIAALAIWKMGAVYCPLFADFGPAPLLARVKVAEIRTLLVGEDAYARAVLPLLDQPECPARLLLLGDRPPAGCVALAGLLREACADLVPRAASAQAALLHFTSGTTAAASVGGGLPRAILHDRQLLPRLIAGGRQALGVGAGDMLWCTGEPGWALHSLFGIIVPLALGAAILIDAVAPTPTRCLTLLADQPVDVWYTTPTVIRHLMGVGTATARWSGARRLRLAASVGEPLSADAVLWGMAALGLPFRDSWWQTETGGVVLAHPLEHPPRAGSMGKVLDGVAVRLVDRQGEKLIFLADEGEAVGELAVALATLAPWRSVGGEPGAAGGEFAGWHLTHDLVRRDEDGNYWFLGRADDVLNLSGRKVGPFEIEAALMGHPAVAEVGVVGCRDTGLREQVVAFVALNPGFDPVPALGRELRQFAVETLGSVLAPDVIHFDEHLPRTPSGKMIRSMLKARI
jgi:acetyl-CoA synthetase